MINADLSQSSPYPVHLLPVEASLCRSWDEFARTVTRCARKIFRGAATAVLLADAKGDLVPRAQVGAWTEPAANELLDGDPLLFAVFEAQIAVHTGQLDLADSANPRLVPRSPRCARSFHGLAAPLYDGSGGIAGVLYVRRPRRAEPFGSADLRRAHALSGHLSASLARVPRDVCGAEPRVVLSPREYQVAILAMRGANNLQIARALHLARETVKKTLQRVYSKLEVNGRAQMVVRLMVGDGTSSAS